jgi:hypothetical protein
MPYIVELKLPLPATPLQEGHPLPDRRPIPYRLLAPAEFDSESEARQHAGVIQDLGYGAAITNPDGNQYLALPR